MFLVAILFYRVGSLFNELVMTTIMIINMF